MRRHALEAERRGITRTSRFFAPAASVNNRAIAGRPGISTGVGLHAGAMAARLAASTWAWPARVRQVGRCSRLCSLATRPVPSRSAVSRLATPTGNPGWPARLLDLVLLPLPAKNNRESRWPPSFQRRCSSANSDARFVRARRADVDRHAYSPRLGGASVRLRISVETPIQSSATGAGTVRGYQSAPRWLACGRHVHRIPFAELDRRRIAHTGSPVCGLALAGLSRPFSSVLPSAPVT
jgi:hypothetical protein